MDRRAISHQLLIILVAAAGAVVLAVAAGPDGARGLRDPAWAPDGKHIAASWFDRIWIFTADGRDARPLDRTSADERDPAWSRDGSHVAFAADSGEGFDIYVVASKGGAAERVTSMSGDERWPSWTPDGRIVFAHRERENGPGGADTGLAQWDLFVVSPGEAPQALTATAANEIQPRVSPDGTRILFVSDRENDDRDLDIWVMPLASHPTPDVPAVRIVQARGTDAYPAWAPGGDRVAFFAMRGGVPSVWVAPVDPVRAGDRGAAHARPEAAPILVSRHGGSPAWSPDGRTILIGELPAPEPDYNGNPERVSSDPPPAFALGRGFHLWTVPAPEPVDAAGRALDVSGAPPAERFAQAFDRVWRTLDDLYYSAGPSALLWQQLRDRYRPDAVRASDESSFESVVDRMILQQPLIKPAVGSSRAVVVSGNELASDAGRRALEKGGNVVDAMIATAFALGVVEPDASSIGGDGQAMLYLKGMDEPTVVEYKDETPIHATVDNPKVFRNGRIVADGPAAMNIPGVVAGLDYLYHHYGSGKVAWEDLLAPAITLADQGFVLDDALPTTVAEGRQYFEKYPEARKLFLPGGRAPRPGDRFVNKDYAETLRAIARGGSDAFYQGEIAHRVAADLRDNGGIIGLDDLAQYHATERAPLTGRFRDEIVYGAPPPVGDGARIIETLQILGHYTPRPGVYFATDPDYFHYLIESWKVRDQVRIGDPTRWPVDLNVHLALPHAAELFKKIDPRRASRMPVPEENETEEPATRISHGTTGFAVADADGNMIVATQTLSTWGGSFYVSKGLGFLYNDHLRSSRAARGEGELLPLTRSSSTNAPTMLFRDEQGTRVPRLAVSAAGNAWIIASIYSIIANVIDGGMAAQQAIEAPRFLVGRDPADATGTSARVQIEDRIPRATLEDLIARGHVFQKIGRKGEVRYGYAALVVIDPARHLVEAGTEPRRSHMAAAVQ